MSDTTNRPGEDCRLDRDTLILELSNYRLKAMWSLRQQATQTFEPFAITPVKALLLELIQSGYTQPKVLMGQLGLSFPSTSTLLREFEARGILKRQAGQGDRRRVELTLTEQGHTLCRDLAEAWNRCHVERYAELSDERLRILVQFCADLNKDSLRHG